MGKQASRQAIAAYLRHRLREAVKVEGARPFARRVKMSHPTVLTIDDGTNALSKIDTLDKLAASFGLTSTSRLNDEAAQFAEEHPELVAKEATPGTRVEIDTVTNPTLGDLPGWEQAESGLPAWIPREAIEGARRLGGIEFRESGRVTTDFVRRAVDLWLAGQDVKDDRSGEE